MTRIIGSVLVAFLLSASPAWADGDEEALGLSIRSTVQEGEGQPALLFSPSVAVKRIGATVRRTADDKIFVLESGPIAKGRTIELAWPQPKGTHAYEARIEATLASGDKVSLAIAFEAQSMGPIEVRIDRSGVDLDAHQMRFTASRRVERAEVVVYGDGGAEIGRGEQTYGGASGKPLLIRWTQKEANVRRMALTVHDAGGFWAGMEVRAMFVEPWEDRIYFAFGSDEVQDREKPKLDATLTRIRKALQAAQEEVGDSLDLRLYVAGYTDTVGTPASNQELSERRARSISRYLTANGLRIPIYYQGFGESVLAVKTPDETENEQNRRTVYVLSSQTPISELFPRKSWKKLQ